MSGWRQRLDDLLYSGESVEETIDIDDASVVVTSRRVLAFTPTSDGPDFQHADRPNVESVTTGAQSNTDLLYRGIKYGLVGLVLLATGLVVDFESIIGGVDLNSEAAQRTGLGDIMGTIQGLLNLIMQLDRLMRVFGALALVLTVVMIGVYWYTRDPTLVIEIAGDEEDIHVPRPAENAGDYADRIERAAAPGTVPSEDVGPGTGPDASAPDGVDAPRDPLDES